MCIQIYMYIIFPILNILLIFWDVLPVTGFTSEGGYTDGQTRVYLGEANKTRHPKSSTYTVLSQWTYKFRSLYTHRVVYTILYSLMCHRKMKATSICFMTSLPFVVKVISILFYIFRLPLYVKKLKYCEINTKV